MGGKWAVCGAVLALAVSGHGQDACSTKEELSHGKACKCTVGNCKLLPDIPETGAISITSSRDGDWFKVEELNVLPHELGDGEGEPQVTLETDGVEYQMIHGFGGAFTDASAAVVNELPEDLQDYFYKLYYAPKGGIGYTMGRVHMGSCDFSRQQYQLVEDDDLNLGTFHLRDDRETQDGFDQKAAMIRRANELSGDKLRVFASAWTAPLFMKTCDRPPGAEGINECGDGFYPWWFGNPSEPNYEFGALKLESEVRQSYANYIVKFFEAYKNQENVTLWGVTTQNEPEGNPTGNAWENMNNKPDDLGDFVEHYLGPTLKSVFPEVKIIVGDDQYESLPEWGSIAVESQYIDGVGFHWYSALEATSVGQDIADLVSQNNFYNKPSAEKFALGTEACTGYLPYAQGAFPGSWDRGYRYMRDLLHQTSGGASGWTDWNIALDMEGGPNHAGNIVDSPILVDSDQAFYLQPMFFAMGHFSSVVKPGSIRMGLKDAERPRSAFMMFGNDLEAVWFKLPDNERCALVLANDRLVGTDLPPRRPIWGSKEIDVIIPTGRLRLTIGQYEWKTLTFPC